MSRQATWAVSAADAGQRLDVLVAKRVGDASRTEARRLIDEAAVLVDGRPTRASYRPRAGETVSVTRDAVPRPSTLTARPDLALDTLYIDDDIVLINKPAGMVVHPAAGHADDTLVNALLGQWPPLAGLAGSDGEPPAAEGRWPGLVHRLDRDTSGVIIVGRSRDMALALQAQFAARTVTKTYLALVHGIPAQPTAAIAAPIGRHPTERKRMAVRGDGRSAETQFEVLAAANRYAWLKVQPRTGRTHQIRVHLASIGHPIVGDKLYGGRAEVIDRPALHAWRLEFAHPRTGVRMAVEAPLPADLRAAGEALGLPAPADAL